MCYTAFYLKKRKNEEIEKILRRELKEKQAMNADGFACLKINENFEIKEYKRELKLLLATKMVENFEKYNLFHFRLATAGKKNKLNIHLWRRNDFIFAHNGTVYTYSRNKEFSDSFLFFINLSEKLKKLKERNEKEIVKILENEIEESNLFGRGFLLDLSTKKLYCFGDLKIYCSKDFLLISSAEVEFKRKRKLFGVDFEEKVKVFEKEIDGYYVFDLRKETLRKVKERTSYPSYYSYYQNRRFGF